MTEAMARLHSSCSTRAMSVPARSPASRCPSVCRTGSTRPGGRSPKRAVTAAGGGGRPFRSGGEVVDGDTVDRGGGEVRRDPGGDGARRGRRGAGRTAHLTAAADEVVDLARGYVLFELGQGRAWDRSVEPADGHHRFVGG